ncbi:MAG: class I SAM-dependent methyltransferase [Gemmatimonadota bacterium]
MSPALYDRIGVGYVDRRRPDPRIQHHIDAALGSAGTVLNVGAGTGSYEPRSRSVMAVEPSRVMIHQRRPDAAPVVRAVAGALPFPKDSFDATLAVLTIHHWSDWRLGIREMIRVARERVVILSHDPDHDDFWLVREYFPEIGPIDRARLPELGDVAEAMGGATMQEVLVPHDCRDGFLGAYWRRPTEYLDVEVRRAISTFDTIDVEPGLRRLRKDLEDGTWRRRNQELLSMDELDIGYRLLVMELTAGSQPPPGG